jgi:hypothetical protein
MIKIFIVLLLVTSAFAAELELSDAQPQKVREIAANVAQQRYSNKTQQDDFMSAYLAGFKSGLVSPHGVAMMDSGNRDDPTSEGFSSGRSEAISNENRLGITLLDYGYVPTNVTGYVFFAFEQSEFRQLGSTQVWWIAYTPELSLKYTTLTHERHIPNLNRTAILGSFIGLLSPDRSWRYGHVSGYRREFVVNKIIELKEEKKPQPAGGE